MTCAVCENGFVEGANGKVPCRPCHRQVASVQRYARKLAALMGLAGWTIEVSLTDAGDDNMAEVDCVYGQRIARIALSEHWGSYSDESVRDTLVHELVHVLFAQYSQLAHDLLTAASESAGVVGGAALGCVEEWVVDNIALAWAPSLPLPEEKK